MNFETMAWSNYLSRDRELSVIVNSRNISLLPLTRDEVPMFCGSGGLLNAGGNQTQTNQRWMPGYRNIMPSVSEIRWITIINTNCA